MSWRREARQMSQALLEASRGKQLDWIKNIKPEDAVAALNAIALGYQLVISRTLGPSFQGMTQLLVAELGSVLDELFKVEGGRLEEKLRNTLTRAGMARDVEVSTNGDEVRLVIRDSLFSPLYRVLLRRGEREFNMSPEALLAASIVAREATTNGAKPRVAVKTRLLDERTLEVTIRVVRNGAAPPRGALQRSGATGSAPQ